MNKKDKWLYYGMLLLSVGVMFVLCFQPYGNAALDEVLDIVRNGLAGGGLGALIAHVMIHRDRKRAERRINADIERVHQEIAHLVAEHHQRSVDEWEVTEEGHEKKAKSLH